jgi:hypothetical protein
MPLMSEQAISDARIFTFIRISPSVDRQPYRNGGPVPNPSFHHQKANAVKDKIELGFKALLTLMRVSPQSLDGLTREFCAEVGGAATKRVHARGGMPSARVGPGTA